MAERLSPEEQERARRRAMLESMRDAGLLERVNEPGPGDISRPPLIELEGGPLSEAIMRERR